MDKTILYRIEPLDEKESFFCKILGSIRSPRISVEDLSYAFMKEEMSFAEASAFAHSAISLFEDLISSFSNFEKKAKKFIKVDKDVFERYCSSKNWSVKKNKSDFYARDSFGFKAKYEENSKFLQIILENDLDRIHFINELEK